MTGEVLRCRRDAGALRPAHPRRRERGDLRRVVAERARADHRITRLRVDVADRSVIHGDAVGAQALRDGACGLLRVGRIAGRADGHRAREDRAVRDAHDLPTLLIDRDRHRRKAAIARGGLDLAQHRAHLLLALGVAAEREEERAADAAGAHAVEILARRFWSVEAGPHERARAETRSLRRGPHVRSIYARRR